MTLITGMLMLGKYRLACEQNDGLISSRTSDNTRMYKGGRVQAYDPHLTSPSPLSDRTSKVAKQISKSENVT